MDGDPATDFVEDSRREIVASTVGCAGAAIAKGVATCKLGNIHTLGKECGDREVGHVCA